MYRLLFFIFCGLLGSCALLQNKVTTEVDCKKQSVKELKRLKKYLGPAGDGGVYTYLHEKMSVPKSFETIFWERKIGRDFAVTVQLYDTTAMQFLQLALSLQDIVYNDCEIQITRDDLTAYFGLPTYISKSMLGHAKETYMYSFNHPKKEDCYHGEYMGIVAYQECLHIDFEIDNKGQIVELNTTSFEVSEED